MRVCDASCSVCALLFLGVPRTPSRSSFDRPQTDTQRTSRGVVSLALLVGREYPACLLAPPQPRHFPPWVGVCVCVWVCVEKDGRGERGGGQLPFSPSNPLPPSLLSSRYYAPLEAPPPHPLCVSYAPLPLRVGPHTTAPLHHSVGRVGSCGTYGVGSERIVRGWVGMRAWGKARDKNAVWVVWDRMCVCVCVCGWVGLEARGSVCGSVCG